MGEIPESVCKKMAEELVAGLLDVFVDRTWTPVGERVPEEYEHVTGWRPGMRRPAEVWRTADKEWRVGDCEPAGNITHWMPLPEPPEGKE